MGKEFSVAEALEFGWAKTKENLGLLISIMLLCVIISILAGVPMNMLSSTSILRPGMRLIAALVNWGLMLGLFHVCFKIADGREASFSDFFEPLPLYPQFVIALFLSSLAVGIGIMLLVIPGLFLITVLFFTPAVVVDQHPGAIDALKRSYALTSGVRLHVFLLFIALALVNAVGAVFCGIGLIVTIPITNLALIHVYRALNSPQEQDDLLGGA